MVSGAKKRVKSHKEKRTEDSCYYCNRAPGEGPYPASKCTPRSQAGKKGERAISYELSEDNRRECKRGFRSQGPTSKDWGKRKKEGKGTEQGCHRAISMDGRKGMNRASLVRAERRKVPQGKKTHSHLHLESREERGKERSSMNSATRLYPL